MSVVSGPVASTTTSFAVPEPGGMVLHDRRVMVDGINGANRRGPDARRARSTANQALDGSSSSKRDPRASSASSVMLIMMSSVTIR
jgi:hypothetical protein